jgi:hypothetical protein
MWVISPPYRAIDKYTDNTSRGVPLKRVRILSRMFKKARLLTRPTRARRDAPFPKRGRSERRGEADFVPYVEPLSDARTKLADFFNILLLDEIELNVQLL